MLTIEGVNKDIGNGVFWGWDLFDIEITDERYSFEFRKRSSLNDIVISTLYREKGKVETPNVSGEGYELFTYSPTNGWQSKRWLRMVEISRPKVFYLTVEKIILENEPLPF